MSSRYRIEEVADLPPAAAGALAILVFALIIGVAWALLRLPDSSRLRSPAARERARRRKESQRRQNKLRARREALQRKSARR